MNKIKNVSSTSRHLSSWYCNRLLRTKLLFHSLFSYVRVIIFIFKYCNPKFHGHHHFFFLTDHHYITKKNSLDCCANVRYRRGIKCILLFSFFSISSFSYSSYLFIYFSLILLLHRLWIYFGYLNSELEMSEITREVFQLFRQLSKGDQYVRREENYKKKNIQNFRFIKLAICVDIFFLTWIYAIQISWISVSFIQQSCLFIKLKQKMQSKKNSCWS
jgi:hypothetical protein